MRSTPSRKPEQRGNIRFRVLLAFGLIAPLLAMATAPQWWTSRAVLKSEAQVNDYASINHGQLKNLAKAAASEMNSQFSLRGGAGDAVNNLVARWQTGPATNNDVGVTIGQLKAVATPFYDRLKTLNLATGYPWQNYSGPRQPDDNALANIGQAKSLFSFAIPYMRPLSWDAWLASQGLPPDTAKDASPNDGAATYWQQYMASYYSSQLAAAILTKISGDNQTIDLGADAQDKVADQPLKVTVTDGNGSGVPLKNAPLIFSVTDPGASQISTDGVNWSNTCLCATGEDGSASIYLKATDIPYDTANVTVNAFNASTVFNTIITGAAKPLLPPMDLQFVWSLGSFSDGSLTWVNQSPKSTGFFLKRSYWDEQSQNWITEEPVPINDAGTTSYYDPAVNYGTGYRYNVAAVRLLASGETIASPDSESFEIPAYEPANAPHTVLIQALNSNQVSLSWLRPADSVDRPLQGYVIRRYLGTDIANTIPERQFVLTADTTSYLDSSLDPETTYTYQVFSFNNRGYSSTGSNVLNGWNDPLKDSDGDGYPDIFEADFASNPNDPNSIPMVAAGGDINNVSVVDPDQAPHDNVVATIQAGIDRLTNTDAHLGIVLVKGRHVYDETIVTCDSTSRANRRVLILGQPVNGVPPTIAPTSSSPSVSFYGSGDCVLSGFIIDGHRADFSTAVMIALNDPAQPVKMTNCIIVGHRGSNVVYDYNGDLALEHCTFYGNIVPTYSSAIHLDNNSNILALNCIFWDSLSGSAQEFPADASTLYLVHSLAYYPDPMLASGGFPTSLSQPVINQGISAPTLVRRDILGQLRDAQPDIGAVEWIDSDHDGLPDWWELKYFGNLNQGPNGDSDGDGMTNIYEFRNGLNPLNPGDAVGSALGDLVFNYEKAMQSRNITYYVSPNEYPIFAGGHRYADIYIYNDPSLSAEENDWDGDGISNYDEIVTFHTDPRDPNSHPTINQIRQALLDGKCSLTTRLHYDYLVTGLYDLASAPPSGLRATPTSPNTAQLNWTLPDLTKPTTIEISTNGGVTWHTIGVVAPGVTSSSVTGLTPNQSVLFRAVTGGTPTDSGAVTFNATTSQAISPSSIPSSETAEAIPVTVTRLFGRQASFRGIKYGFPGLQNPKNRYLQQVSDISSNETNDDDDGGQRTFTTVVDDVKTGHMTTTAVTTGALVEDYGGEWTVSGDTSRSREGTDYDGSEETSKSSENLSNLYSTGTFKTNVESWVPPFSGSSIEGMNSASIGLSDDELSYSITKLEYKWEVTKDPNLVVSWLEVFTPDDGTDPIVEAKSWTSNGATESPVFTIDPTLKNGKKNGVYTVTQLDVGVALDANRDGQITFDGQDATSEQKPLRFWINNDTDTGNNDEEKEGSTPDYQWGRISNSRGLEDFQLLKLNIPPEIFNKVRLSQAQLGLKWKNTSDGTPGVKVYRVADEINEPKDYLWNYSKTSSQTASPCWLSIATVNSTSTAWLPADALRRDGSTDQHPYLLFEGSAKGKGQLCLVIKMNGTETDGPGVWLNLVDVEQMFESAQGTPDKPYPNPPDYIAQEPPRPGTGFWRICWPSRGQFEKEPDETDEAIVYVHGWNMTDGDRRTFSETFFKRLWWKGFKGRFCSFAWPTYNSDDDTLGFIPAHYNKSEYVGWKYGPALKAYVDSISKSSKNVAAHSMGNIVMASALKSGLSVNSYVAMEAAIPAGCYDASDAANSYDKFLQAEQSKPTPDQANPDLGYRGEMAGVAGNFYNFYSANDYALKTGTKAIVGSVSWEGNQVDYKPDGSLNGVFYKYKPSEILAQRCQLEQYQMRILQFGRYVTDHHEVMSFIARPRSEALGVRSTAGFDPFNLADDKLMKYPFGKDRTEHSGQFQRPIQKTHKFFNTLLQKMKVGFNFLDDVEVGDASP